jgi:hypothetical protein
LGGGARPGFFENYVKLESKFQTKLHSESCKLGHFEVQKDYKKKLGYFYCKEIETKKDHFLEQQD